MVRINQGLVQVVGTDHCPFTWKQKQMGAKDFSKIPNGHPAIEHRMELLFSEGVKKGKISLQKYVAGSIAIGTDADIAIINPNKKHSLSKKTHHMNVDYSAYEGFKLTGKVETVLMRGAIAIEKNKCLLEPGFGKFVKRGSPQVV